MFCRSCRAQLAPGSFACTQCGLSPTAGNAYCSNCGNETNPQAIMCVSCGAALAQPNSLNTIAGSKRLTAGICALLLGAFGVHKFLLGYQKEGIIMLAVTLVGSIAFGLGPFAMAVVGIIEGITYLTKSDADFEQTYVVNKKPWL